MRDPGDDHDPGLVIHRVHNPVVAYTDSVVVAALELDRTTGPRIGDESIDRRPNPVLQRSAEAPKSSSGGRVKPNLVVGYPRTSDQGIASSRSSRA